jgi:hypothetical protein
MAIILHGRPGQRLPTTVIEQDILQAIALGALALIGHNSIYERQSDHGPAAAEQPNDKRRGW